MSDQPAALGMWAEMLGLGPILETIQSGDFQGRLQAFADAVSAIDKRTQRIDGLCQAILTRVQSLEAELIEAREYERPNTGGVLAAIPSGNGSSRAGPDTAASLIAHVDDGGTATPDRGNGTQPSLADPFERQAS